LQAEERARRQGEELPAAGLFDSNCITPGTEFMHRLDKHLKFFVRRKLATDSSWAKIKVLYSGYGVPGEGEHKIMEFIRYEVFFASPAAPIAPLSTQT
jgi:5'-3' exoribonuclease 1